MGTIRLLAFGGAREVLGFAERTNPMSQSPLSVAQLLDDLVEEFPVLEPYRCALRVAVNGEYADLQDPIPSGAEVALIPPVAGG